MTQARKPGSGGNRERKAARKAAAQAERLIDAAEPRLRHDPNAIKSRSWYVCLSVKASDSKPMKDSGWAAIVGKHDPNGSPANICVQSSTTAVKRK